MHCIKSVKSWQTGGDKADTGSIRRHMWGHTFACINPCRYWTVAKVPEFLGCSSRAEGVVTCSQPFKNDSSPFLSFCSRSLLPHHLFAPPPLHPLQEGVCDWLMYAGADGDININHLPPSGHRLPWTPQLHNFRSLVGLAQRAVLLRSSAPRSQQLFSNWVEI